MLQCMWPTAHIDVAHTLQEQTPQGILRHDFPYSLKGDPQMDDMRVVLVENLLRPQRMYALLLQQLPGVKLVHSYFYPEELLEALEAGLQVDVIMMDIRMDEISNRDRQLDGLAAAIEIRKRFPKMPIVLYSMWDQRENLERF